MEENSHSPSDYIYFKLSQNEAEEQDIADFKAK